MSSDCTKSRVLAEVSASPGLYADEVAERLKIPTKIAVDLVGELIEEGIIEWAR